jgi:hypothetical protein
MISCSGLIRDLKIYVHNIPYVTTFIIFLNSVIDSSYSMLGRLGLRDVKVAHDWGSNIVTIQGNGTVITITVTKHLGGELRRPKMLLCYNYQNGITYKEKYIIFATEPELFSIGTINLRKTIQFVKTTDVEIMDTSVKNSNSELKSGVQIIKQKTTGNRYEPKILLEDKEYFETYYNHQPRNDVMDKNLAKIKAQEL